MNLRLLAFLFILFISGTAWAEAAAQPSTPVSGAGQMLTADQPLQVTLAGSLIDLTYAGTRGETVTFSARSLAPELGLDTMLEIINENGVRLGFNDDMTGARAGFNLLDSVIPSIQILSDGIITVRVGSFNPSVSGPVEVLVATEGRGMSLSADNSAGSTRIQGNVPPEQEDCNPVNLLAGETITATAHALGNTLDTLLTLIAPDGSELAFNDDQNLNDPTLLRFDAALDAVLIPSDGVYQLCVGGFAGDSGPYELTITRSAGGAVAPVAGGSSNTQVITNTVPEDDQFVMSVNWQAGDVYTLTARALDDALDTQMGIFPDRSDELLVANDDHSSSATGLSFFDSRINNFIVPASGLYDIVVGGYRGVGGPFELTITRSAQQAPLGTPDVDTASGSVAANGVFEHEVTLPANAYVTIKAMATGASALDPQVTLIAPGGVIAAYNDDHSSFDSNLAPTDSLIRNFFVAESGVYTIEVRGYRGGGGDFMLTIETLQ